MVSMVTHEDAAEEKQAEIQGLVSLTNYRLTCCGHRYKEGDDLFRGMKVISCPTCGAMNPRGEKND